MKKLQKLCRLSMFVLLIALAAVLPVPLTFCTRDRSPKFRTEQVDREEEPAYENLQEIYRS